MLLDKQAMFSDAQAITADAASTNVVKLTGEPAFGNPVPVICQVVETFNNLTSLAISLQTATDEDFTAPVTLASETITKSTTTLYAGDKMSLNFLPKGNLGYMRMYYDVTGSAPSTGKITAGIVAALDQGYQDL